MACVGKCNNKPSTTYDTSANFSGLLALRPGTAQQLLCKAPASKKNIYIQNYACGFKFSKINEKKSLQLQLLTIHDRTKN